MSRQEIQRVCWYALIVVIVALLAVKTFVQPGYGEEDLLFLAYLVFAPVGAVIAYRRPDNAIGWVFLCVGLLGSLTALLLSLTERAQAGGLPYGPDVAIPAQFGIALGFPLILLSTAVTFLLYPSGLPSPRWRPVLWLAWALIASSFVLGITAPTVWVDIPGAGPAQVQLENPMSPNFVGQVMSANPDRADTKPLDFTFPVFLGLMAVCIVAAIWAAGRRTWKATGVERLQMRLFASAIALLILVLWPAQYLAENGHSTGRYILLAIAFSLIPLSCGVAILRYRLYDIDRIIGRTTAYVLVTGVLLAVYVVVVTSLTRLVAESGSTGQADSWAVAVATLVAAGLFRPVLRWARRVVDRRFNREQFDAERAVEAFALRLRDEVEGEEVRSDLLKVLRSTVQPASTGLWLKEPTP
jgi:uncharacterized protein (UPF0218 family)